MGSFNPPMEQEQSLVLSRSKLFLYIFLIPISEHTFELKTNLILSLEQCTIGDEVTQEGDLVFLKFCIVLTQLQRQTTISETNKIKVLIL